MENLFMQEHERWLEIVDRDLKSAKLLLKGEVFSTAVYHCQQAAEKALKAYLAFKNHKITKTHDLTKLVESCSQFDIKFETLYSDAEHLKPFATKFRYSTEFDIPDSISYYKKYFKSSVSFFRNLYILLFAGKF